MSDLINSVVKALDALNTTSNNFTAAMVTPPVAEIKTEDKVEPTEQDTKEQE